MKKMIKLKEGAAYEIKPNKPIITITGKGGKAFLWVGNNAVLDNWCFATLSGKKTLEKLANQILVAIGNESEWKSIRIPKKQLKKHNT